MTKHFRIRQSHKAESQVKFTKKEIFFLLRLSHLPVLFHASSLSHYHNFVGLGRAFFGLKWRILLAKMYFIPLK